MTKRIIIITLLCVLLSMASTMPANGKAQTLKSPDGKTVISIDAFKYSITTDGKKILAPSAISMTLADGTVYGGKASLYNIKRRSVNRVEKASVYKKSEVSDKFNELTLVYKDFDLVFRAYNNGVAYRFISKSEKNFDVRSEQAEFAFPDNWQAYVPYCNSDALSLEEQLCCSCESYYQHIALKDWDKGRAAFMPVVVESPDGFKIAITEADLFDFPGLNLINTESSTKLEGFHARYPDVTWQGGHNLLQGIVKKRADVIARGCKPKAEFPWRLIQIARKDTELANSDLVWLLAKPAEEKKDWSWVKPGKVAWEWWNDWGIRGVDFKAGVNNDTYKYYIDFAADHGIEYVILDEGWAVNKQADMMQVVPEIYFEELCDYARQKNVGLILWGGYWAMQRDMEQVFLHYSMMGIKGFKIDFMDRDDQEMVNFYTSCAQMGAKYKMMVDFHGAYKPTGLHRTYPNVVNFEGVHGLENMKWDKSDKQIGYDVTIPFIRMLAGPMDYTPGAMRNANRDNYNAINGEPMSLGTRCRQLAEYVIFDAPLAMLCDSPSNYMEEPQCTKFIAGIPTVWDETLVLNGRIAEYITMARRIGDDWYIGSMTGYDAMDMELELSFLPKGEYSVTIFKDGINSDRAARDFAVQNLTVTAGDKIKLHMAPGGGWAARLTKKF